MSSASAPGGSASRGPLVTILAVIGILAIIAAILYISGAANSLHFMDGAVHKGHHLVRFIVSLVVGVAFLIGAYIAWSRPAASSAGTTGGTTTGTTSGGTTTGTTSAGTTTGTTSGGTTTGTTTGTTSGGTTGGTSGGTTSASGT